MIQVKTKPNSRDSEIAGFLRHHGISSAVQWLAADASFRRYGRVNCANDQHIVMDAPPQYPLRNRAFVDIAALLRDIGIAAPQVLAMDFDLGVLLLEDLGDAVFGRVLDAAPEQTETLYALAYSVVEQLQVRVLEPPGVGVDFDATVLSQELDLFRDWYCPAAGVALSEEAWAGFAELVERHQERVDALPQRFVLRDCHVDNFLLRDETVGLQRCGVLDFQDGGWGSALYDVTSLLFDARRDVPEDLRQRLLRQHAAFLGIDWEMYCPAAAYLVLQRGLKVLGIFVRLNVRDAKGDYLVHLPRCWAQIDAACAVLSDWRDWFAEFFPLRQRGLKSMQAAWPIDTAMLLAAGEGRRMGSLGVMRPKPLLQVAGKALIDHAEARLRSAGVRRFVINAHHLAAQVEAHFAERSESHVVVETERLETGGGVRHALDTIGREAFWVVNGDVLWRDSGDNLQAMLQTFAEVSHTDCQHYHCCGAALLGLIPSGRWSEGRGDFVYTDGVSGTIRRIATHETGLGYCGVMLLNRAAIAGEEMGYFSLNRIFDRLIARERLWGITLDFQFYHVGTPEALKVAHRAFRNERIG